MKIRYAPLAVACALMVAAAATTTAQAAAVTYSFGGTLGQVIDLPSLSVGDTFTGSFTYETTAVDADPDPAIGFYPNGFSINVTVNGYSFSSSTASVLDCPACGGITVENRLMGDDFAASSNSTLNQGAPVIGPQIDGLTPAFIRVVFFGSESLYANDALPTALALSSFNRGNLFALGLSNGPGFSQARGDLAFLTLNPSLPVPEASTSAMLALGLGALAIVRRRKSH